MTFKILICDKIADEGIELMEKKGYEITKAWGMTKIELPEIVGDAAIMINPYNVEELTKAILKIMNHKKLKNGLIRKGYKNLRRFNKSNIKNKITEVYELF